MKKKGGETKKAKKAAKDPNKPKRPPSAFFVFMYDTLDSILACYRSIKLYFQFLSVAFVYQYREEFRKTYKEKHPNNKSVAAVSFFRSRISVKPVLNAFVIIRVDFRICMNKLKFSRSVKPVETNGNSSLML